MHLIKLLKTDTLGIVFYNGGKVMRAEVSAVYYFETVDEKTCACFAKLVLSVHQKLYQLEEMLPGNFCRVSKSLILNLDKIKSISPALSGRYEALMANAEKVIISRAYVREMKRRLGL
ncbi:transcriptional regulator [Clostridia bacterium]|nr:transcriptional regulator [Clostridia bacterium]